MTGPQLLNLIRANHDLLGATMIPEVMVTHLSKRIFGWSCSKLEMALSGKDIKADVMLVNLHEEFIVIL